VLKVPLRRIVEQVSRQAGQRHGDHGREQSEFSPTLRA
jgi:hypothetical protein